MPKRKLYQPPASEFAFKCVFALAQLFTLANDCFFSQSGHQILRVNEVDSTLVIPVCEIQEKWLLGSISQGLKFVIGMPDMHGHGIL